MDFCEDVFHGSPISNLKIENMNIFTCLSSLEITIMASSSHPDKYLYLLSRKYFANASAASVFSALFAGM